MMSMLQKVAPWLTALSTRRPKAEKGKSIPSTASRIKLVGKTTLFA